jgi:hypothetical protein
VRALPLAAGINEGGHWFRLLVRAECVRCPWLLAETEVATILGKLVRAECVRCPWLQDETKVALIFFLLSFFLLPTLFNPQKGLSYGFKFLHEKNKI